LQYVSEQARLLGIHALHLECERQNTPAMTLYRKFGFKDPDRVLMTYWV
jgi:ribosomal protein S18 acetylase RimI-like enzyme